MAAKHNTGLRKAHRKTSFSYHGGAAHWSQSPSLARWGRGWGSSTLGQLGCPLWVSLVLGEVTSLVSL